MRPTRAISFEAASWSGIAASIKNRQLHVSESKSNRPESTRRDAKTILAGNADLEKIVRYIRESKKP
jgi:hypothetical protein